MQVTARRTGLPLDQMTTETYVTTYLKHDNLDYYPQDGAFIHGLYIEGARWPTGDDAGDVEMLTGVPIGGYLVDSRLKVTFFVLTSNYCDVLLKYCQLYVGTTSSSASDLCESCSSPTNVGAICSRLPTPSTSYIRVSSLYHVIPRKYICVFSYSQDD